MALEWFGLLITLISVGQQEASGSVRAAVVNVATVSEKYARTADLEARFEAMRRKFQEDRDALRGRIERTARSLEEELKPGTEAYESRRKELALLEAELQWYVESKGRQIEAGLADSLRTIFSDIQVVVREIAEEKGIDIVLAGDEVPDETPDTPNKARQQILLQKVLFWSPRVDLTAEVIARLNARYKPQDSASPIEPSRPAPGDGGGASDRGKD